MPESLTLLTSRWREVAATLRPYGAESAATALERCADELEARVMEWADEPLTLPEAAQKAGIPCSTSGDS